MRKLILLIIVAAPMWGAARTASVAGNWSNTATWGGAAVPVAGDTVTINTGIKVTGNQNIDIGISGTTKFGYISSIGGFSGGSGFSGTCVATFIGPFTAASTGPLATCVISGGTVVSATLTRRGWFPSTTTPIVVFTCSPSCGAAVQPSFTIFFQPGGGTPAIQLNESGRLEMAQGFNLIVRGDVFHNAAFFSTNTTYRIILDGDDHVTFDASLATPLGDGTQPMYSVGGDYTGGAHFTAGWDMSLCSVAHPCTVDSNTTTPGQLWTGHGFTSSGTCAAIVGGAGIHFSYIGTSIDPFVDCFTISGQSQLGETWNMPRYTCDHCGAMKMDGGNLAGTTDGAMIFIDGGLWSNSIGGTTVDIFGQSALTSGARTIVNAVYDVTACGPVGTDTLPGMTINNSYIDASPPACVDNGGVVSSIVIYANHIGNNPAITTKGSVSDTIVYLTHNDKPNYIFSDLGPATSSRVVFEATENYLLSSGTAFFVNYTPGSPTAFTVTNSAVLPNKLRIAVARMLGPVSGHPNIQFNLNHSYAFQSVFAGGLGFSPAISWDEGGTTTSALSSYKGNLVYGSVASSGYKFRTGSCASGTLQNDACGAAGVNCDYNSGFNLIATESCVVTHTNQGRSYVSNFPGGTPGAHDIDGIDPQMIDQWRNVERWYLDGMNGTTPQGQWTVSTAYAVNDIVWDQQSTIFGNAKIGYQCKATLASSSAADRPMTGANWRTYWEPATLPWIRAEIAAGRVPVPRITTWILAGLATTDMRFKSTSDAASDFGPVVMRQWASIGGIGSGGFAF